MIIERNYIEELTLLVKQHLLHADLIDNNEVVSLTTCHEFFTGKFSFCHFIIHCKNTDKKFFLKTAKPGDSLMFFDRYLKRFCIDGKYQYPVILVRPFTCRDKIFYITSYSAGNDLDEISDLLTPVDWKNISDKLIYKLDELSTVVEDKYSTNCEFVHEGCAEILKRKFAKRLTHPLMVEIVKPFVNRIFQQCCDILDKSEYSKPTLLHMDIKPANLIYNRNTGELTVIDFEFARFGDIDYGKIQLLLTGINAFSDNYKKYVYPHITKTLPTFSEAQNSPKLTCYLLYQTMSNLIYYDDHKLPCPKEMAQMFYIILNKFSSEKNL